MQGCLALEIMMIVQQHRQTSQIFQFINENIVLPNNTTENETTSSVDRSRAVWKASIPLASVDIFRSALYITGIEYYV